MTKTSSSMLNHVAVVLVALTAAAMMLVHAGAIRIPHRPQPRREGFWRPSPPSPTPPSPPYPTLCNRTISPDGVSELSIAGGGDDCGMESPPPPPRVFRQPPCFCPWAPRPAVGFPFPARPGGNNAAGPGATGGGLECVAPLAGLMTCGEFLTGTEESTPTPESECCSGLATFINSSRAAGDGDRTLRCLCPVILGDVNKMLPKPMDPVRMMYLPIACGVVLPPQILYICFTGQQTPPLVGRIPDVWEKPTSAALSP